MALWDHLGEAKNAAAQASAAARGQHFWTEDEQAMLLYLCEDEKMSFEEISVELEIPAGACQARYEKLRAGRRAMQGLNRRGQEKCPNKNLIDREKREAARLSQNLTASIFGDPPPGYSALDRRR